MCINSIRDNMTKDTILSEIRLICSADIRKEYIHLVVEGPDDSKFLKNKVTHNVFIYESFSGKIGVREIIEQLNNKQVIGICDKDYDYQYNNERIFHYDFSCMELMMVHDSSTYESLCCEFYSGSLSHDALLTKIFENLGWLSCFRKLNFINDWGINFNGLSIYQIYNSKSGEIDISRVIKEINQLNNNFLNNNRNYLVLISQEAKQIASKEDYYHLLQGHDFIELFHCYCRKRGVHDYGGKAIVAALRCTYAIDKFVTTNLYSELRRYEQKHNLNIVVA